MAKQTFTTGQVLTAAQMTSLQQTAMGGGEATAKTASYVLTAADAGTTVIMNAAGATTITVNTALFAAGDTVNIQNIGAGICTVTAGTATVNTAGSLALNQYEGGVLYFRSTSAATFFDYVQTGSVSPLTTKGDLYGFSTLDARIPIGTNNQVLTADSTQALGLKWATPVAAGKSYTLINTGGSAISGAITYTYSGLSGYDSYLVQVIGASSTQGNLQIYLTFNGDTASNYGVTGFRVENNSTWSQTVVNPLGSLTNGRLAFGTASGDQTSTVSGSCTILGANTSGAYKIVNVVGGGNWTSGNGNALYVYNGFWKNTATISSISVSTEAGTLDAGTLYIYGAA
jgi:uncharacterized protein YaiE (UPF0345 family)